MNGLILLASYPKSGNTWFRALMASIYLGGREVDLNNIGFPNCADRQLCDRVLGINTIDLGKWELASIRPRIYEFLLRKVGKDLCFKVHDAWIPTFPGGEIPFPKELVKNVIYIVRDPRDVAISFAHHLGRPVDFAIRAMDTSKYSFCVARVTSRPQLRQLLSTWSNHVQSWIDADDLRVHVMKYEDMLAAPQREFRAALDFIGLSVPDRVLSSAIEATRFEKLKSQEEERGFSERSHRNVSFFRRGTSNGWKDILTEEQLNRIIGAHGRMMGRLGYLGNEAPAQEQVGTAVTPQAF